MVKQIARLVRESLSELGYMEFLEAGNGVCIVLWLDLLGDDKRCMHVLSDYRCRYQYSWMFRW